jgi:Uncharacterized conserved protein
MTAKQKRTDFLLLTLGTALIALGVYFFKFPNRFSTGGVSGLALILSHYIPNLSSGSLVFILNQGLLLFGFLMFGKGFGVRTAYSSLLFSGLVWGLEYIIPMTAPFTSQPLMELIFAVTLPAIGSAILFNINASSGGTDIVAMLLKKYTNLNIGRSLFLVDLLITISACFAFGMEAGLFSILGLFLKSVMVDMVLENIKIAKCFHIITSHPEPILAFISEKLNRSATIIDAKGAFSHENRTVLLTVVNRAQSIALRQYAKLADSDCFILITNTSDIIGKGFRGTN